MLRKISIPSCSIFGILNPVEFNTKCANWLYKSGKPRTIETACCTKRLPKRTSSKIITASSPTKLAKDAKALLQPCFISRTTSGSIANAIKMEITTSKTIKAILPHANQTKIATNAAITAYISARLSQSGGLRLSPLAGKIEAKSILALAPLLSIRLS